MRRSTHVLAPIVATAAAALLTGCHSDPQRCVDESNHVVDPSFCKNLTQGSQQPATGTLSNGGGYYNNGSFFPHYYRYYYGGGGGGIGSYVSGGSYAPAPGHSYAVTGTSRGGFGSSFGGGEGGGHGGGGGE